ncbi:MAG: hypothetical protein IOB85_02440 [Methylobacterium sp.]|nr:hypothetical protein [Cupriavidus sp.]MCA3671226.1 hypothetical protein [Methylobacterium sp.]MCA3679786.1 hypothetical protein [Methylobacterium sp.]MCA3704323.1 hypothetical protein [Methylobacterium sp.]
MTEWTPSLVEERLSEAAFVLKRLPAERRRGYFNVWPQIVHDFADKVGQEPRPMRVLPSPAAISRMEETLSWTVGLDPIDGKIVWMRAHGERWKAICWSVGMQRSAAHEHWLYALCVIAWRLNGRRVPGKRSRRYIIELVRDADVPAS